MFIATEAVRWHMWNIYCSFEIFRNTFWSWGAVLLKCQIPSISKWYGWLRPWAYSQMDVIFATIRDPALQVWGCSRRVSPLAQVPSWAVKLVLTAKLRWWFGVHKYRRNRVVDQFGHMAACVSYVVNRVMIIWLTPSAFSTNSLGFRTGRRNWLFGSTFSLHKDLFYFRVVLFMMSHKAKP